MYPEPATYAAYKGHVSCLKKFLDIHNCKINRFLASAACLGGRLECLKYLVEEKKAEPDKNCVSQCTVTRNDLRCLKYIIDRCGTKIVSEFAIGFAVFNDNLVCLKYLVGYLDLPVSMFAVRHAITQRRFKHLEWLADRHKIQYIIDRDNDKIELRIVPQASC